VDSASPVNWRTALKRAGALAVTLGTLEAVGPFSFAPVRVGASIVPSGIQLDISAFLAVLLQNYGTDVQFQLPPVHTVSRAKFALCRNPLRLLPVRPAPAARAGQKARAHSRFCIALTGFLTAALERTPTWADQAEMNRALGVLEQHYTVGRDAPGDVRRLPCVPHNSGVLEVRDW
jgi:hypothetical protein